MARSLLLGHISVQENGSVLIVIANLQFHVVFSVAIPGVACETADVNSLPPPWAEGDDRPRGRPCIGPITEAAVH